MIFSEEHVRASLISRDGVRSYNEWVQPGDSYWIPWQDELVTNTRDHKFLVDWVLGDRNFGWLNDKGEYWDLIVDVI